MSTSLCVFCLSNLEHRRGCYIPHSDIHSFHLSFRCLNGVTANLHASSYLLSFPSIALRLHNSVPTNPPCFSRFNTAHSPCSQPYHSQLNDSSIGKTAGSTFFTIVDDVSFAVCRMDLLIDQLHSHIGTLLCTTDHSNLVQFSAMQYWGQCGEVQCSAVHCRIVQEGSAYSAVRRNAVRCSSSVALANCSTAPAAEMRQHTQERCCPSPLTSHCSRAAHHLRDECRLSFATTIPFTIELKAITLPW
jgi:hypothetical protein